MRWSLGSLMLADLQLLEQEIGTVTAISTAATSRCLPVLQLP